MKEENTSNLPEGWEVKNLDDVCEVEYGTRVVKKRDAGTTYPVYGGGGATFAMDKFNREDSIVIARFAMSERCTRFVKGKFFLNDSGLTVKTKDDNNLLQAFLNWQMLSFNDRIYKLARGTAQKNLNVTAFRSISIIYPKSTYEQQRIVSILGQCFVAIDKAKANAEQNLKNARELFESYLEGVFEKGKLKVENGEWEEEKLEEVFNIRPSKNEIKDKLEEEPLVTFFPMEDLGNCQKYIIPKKVSRLNDVYKGYTYFSEGDVLLAKITPCFENGKLGIAKNLNNKIGFGSSEYIVFRATHDVIPEFLYYFLSRSKFRREGKIYMSGAVGHKRVSKDWIENYLIPFPISKADQLSLIHQLDSLRDETQKLEVMYQQKIDDLEELKKSILQKVFAGGLTSEKMVGV